MTREIKAALATLSVMVHDHVIVGNGRWLSFKKEGAAVKQGFQPSCRRFGRNRSIVIAQGFSLRDAPRSNMTEHSFAPRTG